MSSKTNDVATNGELGELLADGPVYETDSVRWQSLEAARDLARHVLRNGAPPSRRSPGLQEQGAVPRKLRAPSCLGRAAPR